MVHLLIFALTGFHPKMALFPLSGVLRGITSSTYKSTPRRNPKPAIASRSGETADRAALLSEKIAHFRIGN
jgi:hypothetical protein